MHRRVYYFIVLFLQKNADDHLKASGLDFRIVRPGALTNESSTNKIQLEEKLEKQGSISRADVTKTWVEVLDDKVKKNQIFEILTGDTPIENVVRS